MSSIEAPTTPTKTKSNEVGYHQLATPPATDLKKNKIVKLKIDARYTSIHSRRPTSLLSQMVKHPSTPKEAVAVALHPMYRGELLDGKYYDWLMKLYDNDMPNIIRRINKFRGFPQLDNPSHNGVEAEEWKVRYATEKYQSELAQYMPYLEAYWDTCGNNFNTHVEVLDSYHRFSKVDGRAEIIFGLDDDRITGDIAKHVHILSQPPPPFNRTWKKELEDYRLDLLRSREDKRFADLAPQRASSSEPHHITATSKQAGFSVSPDHLMEEAQTPGLLWLYCQTEAPLVSTPVLHHQMVTSPIYSLASTHRLPSGVQYHSPAGDLAVPHSIPDSAEFAEIKARSDIQALANAMGFVPTARLDFNLQSNTQAHQQGEPYASNTPSFPMGALRSPRTSYPLVDYDTSSHIEAASAGTKRKRSDSDAVFIPCRTQAPKRARGSRRKGVRKGRRNKKANNDDDEDFEYEGDDLNDDEKNYEKMLAVKVSTPGASHRTRRRRAKNTSTAAEVQPKIGAKDDHAVRRESTAETNTLVGNARSSQDSRDIMSPPSRLKTQLPGMGEW